MRFRSPNNYGRCHGLNEQELIVVRKLTQKKASAKRQGLDFNIDILDLYPLPDKCPCLGIELDYQTRKTVEDNTVSIDRIDNSKGYVPGNVWIISQRANRIKTNASPGEIMQVALATRKKIRAMEEGFE